MGGKEKRGREGRKKGERSRKNSNFGGRAMEHSYITPGLVNLILYFKSV